MRKMYILHLVMAAYLIIFGAAAFGQTKDDVNLHQTCHHCGMDRGSFDFSRMLIEYDDGTLVAVCSIHCAAIDLANNIDKAPQSIKVGDFNGRQLIDAEKAFWVVGGRKPGVMSKRGKWAFEKKDDAENFMKTNQGKLATFEEAMKTAYEDMSEDTKVIRERRKMKRMKMMERCPVCGMSVSMFTDWNARIEFKDSTVAIFDGSKDMFKYYLDMKKYNPHKNKNDVTAISVKDYNSKAYVDALKAFFVIWSDVYGPMGHEPIPFGKEAEAKKFLEEHRGREILRFNDITLKMIHSLDHP